MGHNVTLIFSNDLTCMDAVTSQLTMMAPRLRRRAAPARPSSTKWGRLLPLLALFGFLLLQISLNKSVISTMSLQSSSGEIFSKTKAPKSRAIPVSSKNKAPRGTLRYNWTDMTLTSPMARRIEAVMTNCSLPIGNTDLFNVNGLGSEIHVWSGKLCNAMERQWRIQTSPPWQWLDEALCGSSTTRASVMNCYFPKAEMRCPNDHLRSENQTNPNKVPSPFIERCGSITNNKSKLISAFRAASMEYLFQSVHPTVIQEAERQLNLVFPGGKVPPDLITVHIRWGDKKAEMDLLPAEDYVKAVKRILERRERGSSYPASIFLATEDPKAFDAFREAAPNEWTIYLDQYFHDMLPYRNTTDIYNQAPQSARETKGRAGLVAIASLLVAMEANDYVLTLVSNWSRMMNELRKNVIDPRCNNCTNMIDLKFAEW